VLLYRLVVPKICYCDADHLTTFNARFHVNALNSFRVETYDGRIYNNSQLCAHFMNFVQEKYEMRPATDIFRIDSKYYRHEHARRSREQGFGLSRHLII
jgi:hypothetical protein